MAENYVLTGDEVKDWESLMFLYSSAIKEIMTKIEILKDEFEYTHHYNPIEHVTSRLKTPQSIVRKLKLQGYETDINSMQRYLNDIAGVRVVCSFTSDIYRIADMISGQADIKTLLIKNYIASPKANGYKSYHMVVTVPVFLSDRAVETKVEIQIRTIAMDFWASLEHKIYYKLEGNCPDYIKEELTECARMVSDLDERMLSLNEAILKLSEEEGGL